MSVDPKTHACKTSGDPTTNGHTVWIGGKAYFDSGEQQPSRAEIDARKAKIQLEEIARTELREERARKLLEANKDQAMDGVAFLELVETGPTVWGSRNVVPWATQQGFMIFGTDGTGKSTVVEQIMLARLGLRDSDVLGCDVAQDDRPILYLALDRPAQIRQSIARMVNISDPNVREVLKRRLVIWRGHLPFQCDQSPEQFVDWCVKVGGSDVGLVIGDSVKDMVSSCTDDQAGAGFQQTVQRIIDRSIEFGCCHHNRKANALNSKPRQLQDVYGSRWLTAGMGSVLNIWKLDEHHRELTQLKAPYGTPIQPVEYADDYLRGESKATDRWTDVLTSALVSAGNNGLTDAEAVSAVFGTNSNHADYNANRQKISRVVKHWISKGVSYERADGIRNETPYKIWRFKSAD